jgi:fermentation-respiration switch protein FrsA (DUF1100 family)
MRRRLKRGKSLSWLLGSGLAIAALEVGRRIYRHYQIFDPSPDPVKTWDPIDYGIPADAVEKLWIDTPDGERLYAWYCRSKHPKASALWCHGNTGNLTISADVAPHLLDAGINLLFFDYRGFGLSTGIATYNGVIADGVTAARFHDKIRPQHLPSIAYGFSLGGAVAAQVIRRHPFDALILQSTFTSLPRLARVLWPRFPMHLFTGDLFDTIGVVRHLNVPLLVIHGSQDEVVPCAMAHEMYDACPSPKSIHIVENGLHKDLFLRDSDGLVWATSQFIAGLHPTHRPAVIDDRPHWTDLTLRAVRRAIRKVPA